MMSPVWFSSHQRTGSTLTPRFASSRIKASIKVCDPPWDRKNGSECEKRTFIGVAQKYFRGSRLVSIASLGQLTGPSPRQQPQGEAADGGRQPGGGDFRWLAGLPEQVPFDSTGDEPPFGLVQLSFNCHGNCCSGLFPSFDVRHPPHGWQASLLAAAKSKK